MKKEKILIAIDSPDFAPRIVHNTCNLINKEKSELVLLNVEETTLAEEEYFYAQPQKFIQHEAQKADFAKLEAFLEEQGYDYKGFVYKDGDASKIILDMIEKEKFDLVVVGSHNKTKIERFFLGSVSYKISRHSKSSVLIIKPDTDIKKDIAFSVLLGIDSSDCSTQASGDLSRFVDKNRAKVSILTVRPEIYELVPPDAYLYADLNVLIEESKQASEKVLKAHSINVMRHGLDVEKKYHIAAGNAASTIMKEAKEQKFDLIALGSCRKKGITTILLGSVSSSVYEYSKKAVLIIR